MVQSDRAVEQRDAPDEAGASDGVQRALEGLQGELEGLRVLRLVQAEGGLESLHGAVAVLQAELAGVRDERLVVVEGIPAMLCEQCGEQFYDDATAIGLDLLRGTGFPPERARRAIEVPVFEFGDAAAPSSVQ